MNCACKFVSMPLPIPSRTMRSASDPSLMTSADTCRPSHFSTNADQFKNPKTESQESNKARSAWAQSYNIKSDIQLQTSQEHSMCEVSNFASDLDRC